MKKLIVISAIVACSQMLEAKDVAHFTAVAIDEVSGLPVEGVKIHANFEEYIGIRAWTESPNPDSDVQITGADGSCKLKGKTNCGEVCCFVIDPTTNYYAGTGWGNRYKSKDLFGDWQPDNLVATIKLQRVEHPIPLFVKQVELTDFRNGLFKENGPNGVLKFDLMKGDWLPPYGNGICADLTIESTKTVTGAVRDFNFQTRKWDEVPFFDFTQRIAMPSNDCLTVAAVDVTSAIKMRSGTDLGQNAEIVRRMGLRRRIDKRGKWHYNRYKDYDEHRCYTFRIRSRYDEDGKLTEAYYGKIYGDFAFQYNEDMGLTEVRFLYYMNPTSLDKNLEWDRENNLFADPERKVPKKP